MKHVLRHIRASVLWLGLVLAVSFAPIQPVAQEQAGERTGTSEHANEERGGGETFWQRTTTDPVAFFTLWIAAFTFVLAASTIWVSSRNRREMKIIQRAYIAVHPGGVKIIKDIPTEAIANIEMENVGRLPARNVRWTLANEFMPSERRADFPIDEYMAEGRGTLPPGAKMRQETQQFNARHIHFADMFLYVWGVVLYEDGFGRTKRTRFCHRYRCIRSHPGGTGISAEFGRLHAYGNEAD